jgi:Beige/BEACH domain
MQLNTLAGRTYNDLNQYPVFPWWVAPCDVRLPATPYARHRLQATFDVRTTDEQ